MKMQKPSRKHWALWVCNVWQTISLSLLFWRLSNMYFSEEWKKSDLISVPSDPFWGCTIISLTSLKDFLSDHATKKWRRRKPSRKIPAIWMCDLWQTISLSLLLQRLSNMYFSDEWKKSDLNSVPSETIWGCNMQHAAKNKWWFIFAATSAKLQVAKKWGEYVIPLKTKTKHLWPDTRVVHVFMKIIIELFVLPFLNANTVCTYLTD